MKVGLTRLLQFFQRLIGMFLWSDLPPQFLPLSHRPCKGQEFCYWEVEGFPLSPWAPPFADLVSPRGEDKVAGSMLPRISSPAEIPRFSDYLWPPPTFLFLARSLVMVWTDARRPWKTRFNYLTRGTIAVLVVSGSKGHLQCWCTQVRGSHLVLLIWEMAQTPRMRSWKTFTQSTTRWIQTCYPWCPLNSCGALWGAPCDAKLSWHPQQDWPYFCRVESLSVHNLVANASANRPQLLPSS